MKGQILIDDREHQVWNTLPSSLEIPFVRERLSIGDFLYLDSNDVARVIFERKTWNDLACSMMDGRKDNLHNILQYAKETETCKVVYLIEGTPCPSQWTKLAGGRVDAKRLRCHLDRVAYRDGVIVLHSPRLSETVPTIERFCLNIASLCEDSSTTSSNHKELAQTKRAPLTLPEIRERSGATFPGLSVPRMKKFFQDVPLRQFFTGDGDNFQQLIGPERSRLLLEAGKTTKQAVRFLAAIPGISKDTAQHLVKEYPEWYNLSEEEFRNMTSSKRKLGPLLAQRIYYALTYPCDFKDCSRNPSSSF